MMKGASGSESGFTGLEDFQDFKSAKGKRAGIGR
jgi:hypothetical protein